MGCCSSKDGNDTTDMYNPLSKDRRFCTPAHFCDHLFLIIFILYWLGMIGIGIWALVAGNPIAMIMPTDYENNICGYPKGPSYWGGKLITNNTWDLSEKKYLWYLF
jgi:hypothetical protein